MVTLDRDGFLAASRDWATRAINAYLSEDHRVVLVNAAIALEHLCKAFLCEHHPALLSDLGRKDFDSLLYLCGLGKHAKRDRPRTISGTEALARVRRLLPGMITPQEPLNTLTDVRDGMVHGGLLPPEDAHEVMTAYLRASSEIYEAMGISPAKAWGRHTGLVNSLISDSISAVEQRVITKIEAARQRFMQLIALIPEDERGSVVAAREVSVSPLYGEVHDQIGCPACECEAVCFGDVDIDATSPAEGKDGQEDASIDEIAIFYPKALTCGACDLRLRNREELKAAGLWESWEVDPELYSPESDYDEISI